MTQPKPSITYDQIIQQIMSEMTRTMNASELQKLSSTLLYLEQARATGEQG